MGQLPEEVEYEALKTKATENAVNEINDAFLNNPKPKPKAVKLKKTLLLEEATEALEERTGLKEKIKEKENVKVKTRKLTESVESGEIVEESEAKASSVKATKTRKKKSVEFDIVE